jgi:hypothetical protein
MSKCSKEINRKRIHKQHQQNKVRGEERNLLTKTLKVYKKCVGLK